MKDTLTQHIALAFIAFDALSCSSCSSTNSFIVVNASRAALEVSYRVKPPNVPGASTRMAERAPETLPVSQLNSEVAWQPLPASRYTIDADNRVVVLELNPDEAVLLTRCRPANDGSSGDCQPDDFSIAEIELAGTNGEMKLSGEQAHKIFVRNKNTYTLTYY